MTAPALPAASALAPAPSLAALFLTCLKIGLFSFGGGLSGWLHREFVLRRRWIDDEDFAGSLAVAQILPGANVVNLVIALGDELRGAPGAALAALGFLVGPFFAVLALAGVYDRISASPALEAITQGVTFAAIGLLLTVCVHGARRIARAPSGLLVLGAVAVAVGLLRWPLVPVALAAIPAGVGLAWARDRHA